MPRALVSRLLIWLCALLCFPPAVVAQSSATVQNIEVSLHDDGWRLDADVDFQLTPQVREAVERGLPLHFATEAEITRPRWWWFDRPVVRAERIWSVSYNALLRQWRVSTGGLALPVASLDAALAMVRHIGGWVIAPPDAFKPGERYEGRVRMRLDVSQLSRPLQVNALNSSAWALSTPWASFTLDIPSTLPQPAAAAGAAQ